MAGLLLACSVAAVAVAGLGVAREAVAADPYIDGIRRFEPGLSAGFGQEAIPGAVLGGPEGAGELAGSTHVLSIGHGGTLTVVFRKNVVVDGPGDDLVIFENPFHVGGAGGQMYEELAIVQVSADGKTFVEFPFDAASGQGLAGRVPVLANSENGLDPFAPGSGGDRFDIGALGLDFVRMVRIIDAGDAINDLGNQLRPWGNKAGFDLDALGAIHSSPPGRVSGVVSRAGAPVSGAKVKLIPAAGGRNWRRRARADGSFNFRRVLPTGDYTVRARKQGVGKTNESIFVGLEQLSVFVEPILP